MVKQERLPRNEGPYKMVISRKIVDKLGVKLYDKPSAVVGETIANSYDADAKDVRVSIPLNVWLATWKGKKPDRKVQDKGYEIVIEDDGHGMTPEEANNHYLRVGPDRRKDRGVLSRSKRRKVMGRKGIGKLAPFGICRTIEVWSAGGEETADGYEVSHFMMHYDDIVQDEEAPYYPEPGKEDGSFAAKTGTRITLRSFNPHRVPDRETFHRQLARRFSLELPDFKIRVEDAIGKQGPFKVGSLKIDLMEETKIVLDGQEVIVPEEEEGEELHLPVSGWVAYARQSYQNVEVAGVRIYAWGKLAAVTRDFGIRSGFTGENTVRAYLVGEIHANWIDEEEDFIRTDRQDMLWNSARGQAFQKWGQELIKELGRRARGPGRTKRWKVFREKSELEEHIKRRYADPKIRAAAMEVGRLFSSVMSEDDLEDDEYVERIRGVVLTVAPQKFLVDKLQEIRADADQPMDVIVALFNDVRIGETASLGQVVERRLDAIESLEDKVRLEEPEDKLQKLIENAPWLLDPQWTVLVANRPLKTFREAFERWYQRKFAKEVVTSALNADRKKPDFILIHIFRGLRIIEIKKPGHILNEKEFDRLLTYLRAVNEFLDQNEDFRKEFSQATAVLVCDDVRLSGAVRDSYDYRVGRGDLVRKTWEEIISDTKKVHQDFLDAQDIIRETEVDVEA